MKKKLASFLCIIYLISMQACFASENLYFLKNTKKEIVSTIIENSYAKDKKFTLRKTNPFLAISEDGEDYTLVILQKSSENVFFYIQASKGKKIKKEILKQLKKQKIDFEESENTMYITTFEKQAQKILTNTTNNYDFQEEHLEQKSSQTQAQTQTPKKADNTVLRGYVGEVAKGSTFNTYLQTPINTSTAKKGDLVTAILTENWTYNGGIIAKQGSVINGTITKARNATHGSINGRVIVNFNQLVTTEGKVYNLSTEKIDFAVTNDGKVSKTVATTAKATAVGALGGLLVGLLCGDVNLGIATAIGASVGAGGALISTASEKGIDAEIPTYTELELKLTKPLNVVLKY